MITIKLNGESKMLSERCTVRAFLESTENNRNDVFTQQKIFAIAVNSVFVPKGLYSETFLKDQDEVELLVPMQGG